MNSSAPFYSDERRVTLALTRLAAPLAIVGLFFSVLAGESRLAFRDVSHFYTPLYDYVSERCASDRLPLWNPLDQTGIPLIGETTTAVLYPVRYVLFSLPLNSATLLGWYVVIHLVLASLTAWIAARWCGASRISSRLAGVVYPLSGSVVFLYTNPPFLVAAAWMPLVLGACLGKRSMEPVRRVSIVALSLAMMVLGGDPQTALHATLVVAMVLVYQRVIRGERQATSLLLSLVIAGVFASLLTLPQLAASISWSRQSYRVLNDEPTSLWSPPSPSSQQYESFSYSLPPWHLLELVTPNAFGDLFPQYRRWSVWIPMDGRVWTPSLYAGLISLLALLVSVTFMRGRWHFVAALAALAACGSFGVGWFVYQCWDGAGAIDPAAGGVSWWLYHFLPGYASFRYPAKWLPFLALATSIITALYLDRLMCPKSRAPRRALIAVASACAIALLASYWIQYQWQFPQRLPSDRFWGAMDIDDAITQVRGSLVHTIVVIMLLALAMRVRTTTLKRIRFAAVVILITTVELSWAANRWIAVADQSSIAITLAAHAPPMIPTRWLRTIDGRGFPSVWRRETSDTRFVEVEATQQASWFGRWHLADRQAVLNNMTSIRSNAATRFWQAIGDTTRNMDLREQAELWNRIRHWLDVDGVVVAKSSSETVQVSGQPSQRGEVEFTVDAETSEPFEIHTTWNQRPPSDHVRADLARWLGELSEHGHEAIPTVFSSDAIAMGEITETPDTEMTNRETPSASVIDAGPESMRLRITTDRSVLVTRSVLQDGHWHATLRSVPSGMTTVATVHNVDHLAQGVVVPEGDWEVEFDYRPRWLAKTLVIAAIAWLAWLGMFVRGPAMFVWWLGRRGR